MSFARMWVLHFLWLVPASALLLLIRARLEKRALERLADPGLLPRLAGTPRKGLRLFRGAFQVLGLGFMVLALAGPRWGSRYQEVHRKGVDIMVVVDISSSMRVADVKPNRLERSRREVRDFLRVVKGDRVGLVAFSGAAFVQCPLTLDYAALEMFLGALEPGLIPVPGTDLGAALDTALSAFDMQKETDRVILLITDGEDHEGKGLEAAGRASEKEVRVYVFGVGDPAGGPVPGEEGGFRKDREGKMILSRLREASLREIASATGGRYVRSRAGDLDLDLLYFNGIKRDTQDAELKSGKIRVREERFALFALAAFVLLLLAGCLRDRDRGVTAALVLWATLCLLNPFPAQAGPGAEELYRQGRYEEAERAYAREDMDHPGEVRHRYNRGCAAYMKGDYQSASSAFSSVLKRTRDPRVRYRAAFNRGNAAYRQGDFLSAADHYREALVLRPGDPDAAFNLELALRALARRKQEEKKEGESKKKPGRERRDGKGEAQNDRKSEGDNEAAGRKSGSKGDGGPRGGRKVPRESEDQEGLTSRGSTSGEKADASEDHSAGHRPLPQPEVSGGGNRPREPLSGSMSPGEARALLDNVREDPGGLARFLLREKAGVGLPSGKDW